LRLRLGLLAFLVALAGCGGGGGSAPSPINPGSSNPSSTTVTVQNGNGTIQPNVVVTLSTGISEPSTPTGILETQTTNANGVVTFTGLPSTGTLCVSAVLGSANNATFEGQCFEPFPSVYTLQ
jgi:hypothetical protein